MTDVAEETPAEATPASVWRRMMQGNERFVAGEPQHPRQDVERRARLADSQAPVAALFGCSDSRLAAEIIFDAGLGDLFVIRTAGQVIDASVLGSLEYAVAVLHVPLIVVLGHDSCGAVAAAVDRFQHPEGEPLPHYVDELVDRIGPSVRAVARETADREAVSPAAVLKQHIATTLDRLVASSRVIRDAVADGSLALVSANYVLANGAVAQHASIGQLGGEI